MLVQDMDKLHNVSHARLMDERENHPDHWFRRVARGYWLEARTAAAEFVGADVDDVVFVSNATTGMISVTFFCLVIPYSMIERVFCNLCEVY